MSLSPIEIAKAFDAPLLRERGTSNMPVDDLLKVVGKTKVRYGRQGNGEEIPAKGGAGQQGKEEVLEMNVADSVSRPKKGMVFPG